MAKTLEEIAQALKDNSKKVQLIYAFNGVGKTRLSRIFKDLVTSEQEDDEKTRSKIIYYNAFTEDLFYWDNDLEEDANRKLKIRPNGFTHWVFVDEGQDKNIINNFQRYTSNKLTPRFNEDYSEVNFSVEGGNETRLENIKISKGEENCLIWCIFYSLLKEVIETLNITKVDDRPVEGFNELEYVFIDDPVSSLDENHLIELAVDIADLIKSSQNKQLKFIITTHSPLFYNVLYNELNSKATYMLRKNEDGTFELEQKDGDSNKSFSYHLFLKQTIEDAIQTKSIQKYHFILLRNLYEKTASFFGYPQWSHLLPDEKLKYYNRIIQCTSHSTLSNEAIAEPTNSEKEDLELLFNHLVGDKYWKEGQQR